MSTSSIYRELSENELKSIMHKHFNTDEFIYSVLTGGMFNTTYLITLLTTNQKYVLRVGPVNRHLLLPFEHNLMQAEKYFCDLCDGKEIPLSKIVACNSDKKMFDRDYMIVEYIESSPLSEVILEKPAKDSIYEEVGAYSEKIHSITGDKFGRLSELILGKSFSKWSEYLKAEINGWVLCYQNTDIFTSDELDKIQQIFVKYTDILDEITVPHLIHADLWEGNILVCNQGDEHGVAAIIDGDRAVFGDIDYEFASGWMINDAFLKGYGSNISMNEHNVIRRKIYSLIFYLIEAYVCLIEYNNAQNSMTGKNHALKCIEQLI